MENKLSQIRINIKDFENPPDKAIKLYEAVVRLLESGKNVSELKVSDITSEAGIGKGTAYEYFSTKEELITRAMFFRLYKNIKKVMAIVYMDSPFEQKFDKFLDYMWDNRMETNAFKSLISVFQGTDKTYDVFYGFDAYMDEPTTKEGEISESMCVLEQALNHFMKQAYDEKLITEENVGFRKKVFCSQLIQYIFFLQDYREAYDKVTVKKFVYEGFLKILNE